MLQQTSLQNEHVMAAEWEKADNLQELDISATDLSKECLMDVLPRIPALQWLSAGQLDGMTDAVFKVSYLLFFIYSHIWGPLASLCSPLGYG